MVMIRSFQLRPVLSAECYVLPSSVITLFVAAHSSVGLGAT